MIAATYCNGSRNYRVDVEQGGHATFTIDGEKTGSARWIPSLGLYCIPPNIPRDVYLTLEQKLILALREGPTS